MEPRAGFPDFSHIDEEIIQFQGQDFNNFTAFRGHPIYFPKTNPTWLLNNEFTTKELTRIMQQRITQLMGRYQGIIKEWVVVNEPCFRGAPDRRADDIFFAKLGEDYVDVAFEMARSADPLAILIFNDSGNHIPGSPGTKNSLKTVARLHRQGLVDAVGLEMHLSAQYPPTADQLKEAMKDYPVPVYVTELDVNLSRIKGTPAKRFSRQADIYADVLSACLDSGNCHSVSVWGIGDRHTWLEKILKTPKADATLFDDDFNPKPAYYAIYDLLQERLDAAS